MSDFVCASVCFASHGSVLSLLVLYSNFIGVKWEKEALVPRVGLCATMSSASSSSSSSSSALRVRVGFGQGGATRRSPRAAKRKRTPNVVWSPPVEVKKKRKKNKKNTKKNKKNTSASSASSASSSAALKTKTRKLADGFLPYRTRFAKHTNTIVFHEQYLLAHASDSKASRGDGRRVQDSKGMAMARAHVAWAKHALRRTLLELVETVHPDYTSLPDAAFDEDGIDADLIECCACSASHCTDDNDILMCDGPCRRAYHMRCLTPPVAPEEVDANPECDWYCWQCDAVLDCLDLLNERVESVSYEDVPRYEQMRAWFFAEDVSVLGGLRPDAVAKWGSKAKVEGLLLGKRVFRKVRSNAARIDVEGKITEVLEEGKSEGGGGSTQKRARKGEARPSSSFSSASAPSRWRVRVVFVDGETKDI